MHNVRNASRTWNFVDLFCGGGLGARGAVQAGANPIVAADLWNIATSTYASNFSGASVHNARIEDLDPRTVVGRRRVDLLLTSPECTNHTPARGSRPRDETSRDTALTTLRWAEELSPAWIVLENVSPMKFWPRYQALLSGLKGLGYFLREQVLCASQFGVPQRRRRLFITCGKEMEPPKIPLPRLRVSRTVWLILDRDGTWPTTPLETTGRAKRTLENAQRAIDELGNKEPFLLVYYGSDKSGGWQSVDEPLRTVTTLDRFALVTPHRAGHRMRMLQPRELARAMGLPASHLFPHGSRRDRIRLCGNGVCAPVMKAIVEALMSAQ